jgi:hypothetical protein
MVTKKMKTALAHLTGRVPLELKEDLKDGVPVPSDAEIKNLLCTLPARLIHSIHIGPTGDRFKRLSNEAMSRLAEIETKNSKPANGRVASVGVLENLKEHEIGISSTPIDPSKNR